MEIEFLDKQEKLKKIRIEKHLERLEEIKKLSVKIAKEILLDEVELSANEVEIMLSLLKVDLETLSRPSKIEIIAAQSRQRFDFNKKIEEYFEKK